MDDPTPISPEAPSGASAASSRPGPAIVAGIVGAVVGLPLGAGLAQPELEPLRSVLLGVAIAVGCGLALVAAAVQATLLPRPEAGAALARVAVAFAIGVFGVAFVVRGFAVGRGGMGPGVGPSTGGGGRTAMITLEGLPGRPGPTTVAIVCARTADQSAVVRVGLPDIDIGPGVIRGSILLDPNLPPMRLRLDGVGAAADGTTPTWEMRVDPASLGPSRETGTLRVDAPTVFPAGATSLPEATWPQRLQGTLTWDCRG